MITPAYVRTMAAYNAEMNRRLYEAAGRLDDTERRAAKGRFLDSIHGTLVHILWGDHQWMSRFDNWPRPATPIKQSDRFDRAFRRVARRRATRPMPISRAGPRRSTSLARRGSGLVQRRRRARDTPPKRLLVTHFFNHQTHHRGQAHAMITAAGRRPSDTDLFLLVPQIVG